MDEIVCLKNLTKKFGNTTIIKQTSITIPKGEIYGLLGPSGAGKTTLIKMIVGIEKPTSGELYLFNKKMPSYGVIRRIGYMSQTDGLYQDLTGYENLTFFASLYGIKGNERAQRIAEILNLVDLSKYKHKLIQNYSGGMKRRISLGIALLHKPDLIVLDEPTVGIDPILRQSIWNEFYHLINNGLTIIVTTHVMDEAEKCNQLAMMCEGSIIAVGSPSQLKKETNTETIEQAFLYYGGIKNES